MTALNPGDLVVGDNVTINRNGETVVSAEVIAVAKPSKRKYAAQMVQIRYVLSTESGLLTFQQPFWIDGCSKVVSKV